MAYIIDIQTSLDVSDAIKRAVMNAANLALEMENAIDGAELTILLTDDDTIQQLNSQYLGEDRPTDVLSFPFGEPLPGDDGMSGYLGDIVISLPFAERQANHQGHGVLAELQLLTVHGVLHLLGCDHSDANNKAQMWKKQADILAGLGLVSISPTEEYHEG